jgi:hypothetical protein
MNKEMANKAVVGRWFTEFWGKQVNLAVVDEIAAPNMLLKYSLHEPRRGRNDIKAFMTDFRAAFPDLNFWGTADLIAEGDYVVGRWEGGGPYGARLRRLSDREASRRDRPQDALHGYNRVEGDRRQDRGRDRPRRRCDCVDAT